MKEGVNIFKAVYFNESNKMEVISYFFRGDEINLMGI